MTSHGIELGNWTFDLTLYQLSYKKKHYDILISIVNMMFCNEKHQIRGIFNTFIENRFMIRLNLSKIIASDSQ